jgi:hypothetical protein
MGWRHLGHPRGGRGCGGPQSERTGGPAPQAGRTRRVGSDRLAGARGAGTAATAADLHGGAGAGLAQGQEPAEANAPEPVEHAGQRAAGDAAQRWAQDRRDRRGGRFDSRGQGGCGGAGAPVHLVVASPRGQARVHPEGIKPCEASSARNSRDLGSVSPEPGQERAGARVGGPVRAPIVWVPAGPRLPRRDRGDLQRVQRPDGQPRVGAGRRLGRGVESMVTLLLCSLQLVRTARFGRRGVRYAGLSCVRSGRGRRGACRP